MKSWEDLFGPVPASFEARVQDTLAGLEDESMNLKHMHKKARPAGRIALIAAIAAALLAGTALAVSAARAEVTRQTQTVIYEATGETAREQIVGFSATDSGPVHLGVWELTEVPAGFERADTSYMIVDTGANGAERWENDAGDAIGFQYQAAYQRFGDIALEESQVQSWEDVTVNGGPGQLCTRTDGEQLLLWTDGARGIGFTLNAPAGVDILSLAESVREVPGTPELSEETRAALDELGTWDPAALPQGYELYFSYGWPGEYGYVYRTYENAAHAKLYLHYEGNIYSDDIESYAAYYRALADLAETMEGSPEPSGEVQRYAITELTVQGMPARLVEREDGTPELLAWMDEADGLVFMMRADALSSDALVAAAGTVAPN